MRRSVGLEPDDHRLSYLRAKLAYSLSRPTEFRDLRVLNVKLGIEANFTAEELGLALSRYAPDVGNDEVAAVVSGEAPLTPKVATAYIEQLRDLEDVPVWLATLMGRLMQRAAGPGPRPQPHVGLVTVRLK